MMVAAAMGLEAPEIVVTGTLLPVSTGSKTATDPRDVPASIVVVPGEVIRQQDARTLDDALENASAVAPSYGGGYGFADNYVIRGLPMRFLRDGLPDGPSFVGYRRTLADVASLEVLKGPGSALYGRAEAGGSVNLTTLKPERDPALDVAASYGRFDSYALSGDLTGPLGDRAAARLIGNYEEIDGYRGLSRRLIDVLPTVTASLGRHRLTFDYDRRDQRQAVDNYGIPFTVDRRLAAVDMEARFYSPFNRVDQRIDRFTLSDEAVLSPAVTLRAALIHDARELDIRRNAGGNALNAAGAMTGRGGRTQTDDDRFLTGQVEAVLSGRSGALDHQTLLGFEYADARLSTTRRTYALADVAVAGGTARATDPLPTATLPGFAREIRSDTLSIYAQEQLKLGRLRLRAGGRYDAVKLVDDGTVGTVARRIAGSPELFSWQVGAVYEASPALSFYAGYSRGSFVAIQTEATALSPVPERSSQIEAGIKAEPVAGKLRVDLAAFQTDRDRFFVALAPGADPVQVGRQRSRGVELDVVGTVSAGFDVIANLAYVDATNGSSALASIPGIAVNQSTLGKRLASTPEWSGSFWANYRVAGGALAGLQLGAGVVGKGAVFVDALELLRVPGYVIGRASVGYEVGRLSMQVTVNNLTNARYYSVPTFIGALPGEPRSAQVTLRVAL